MNHTLFFTLTIDHLSWKSLVYMRCCSKNWRQEIDKHIQLNAIKRNENPSIINRAAIEDGRCVICFEKTSNAFWHSIWNIHAHVGCLINQLKDSCELTHISSDILNKLPSQDLPQNVETIRTENGRLKMIVTRGPHYWLEEHLCIDSTKTVMGFIRKTEILLFKII
tara:strand:+ start:14092 stop:14589 length:498 start_codon:yes stop_codon:yes gene_type:complete